jgi:hypothetical protein
MQAKEQIWAYTSITVCIDVESRTGLSIVGTMIRWREVTVNSRDPRHTGPLLDHWSPVHQMRSRSSWFQFDGNLWLRRLGRFLTDLHSLNGYLIHSTMKSYLGSGCNSIVNFLDLNKRRIFVAIVSKVRTPTIAKIQLAFRIVK